MRVRYACTTQFYMHLRPIHIACLGQTKRLGASVPPTCYSPHAYAAPQKCPIAFPSFQKRRYFLSLACVMCFASIGSTNMDHCIPDPVECFSAKARGFMRHDSPRPPAAMHHVSIEPEPLLSATTANSTLYIVPSTASRRQANLHRQKAAGHRAVVSPTSCGFHV